MTDTPVQFVSTLSPTTFTPSVNVTLRSASTLSVSALARHRPVVGTRSLPSMGSVEFVGHVCWAYVCSSVQADLYILCIPWSSL